MNTNLDKTPTYLILSTRKIIFLPNFILENQLLQFRRKAKYISIKRVSYIKYPYLEEALSYYNIAASNVTLLRHNENLTYRIGNNYLLQIYKHVDGFQTAYIYEGLERIEVYKTEIAFQEHLKKRGMRVRETIKNNYDEKITQLRDGTLATISKWIEGKSLDQFELNDELCYQVGELTARLHKNANGFQVLSVLSYDQQHCECTKKRLRMLEDKGLEPTYSKMMQRSCDLVGITLQKVQNEFIMLHGDLSTSNILKTAEGLVAIDFFLWKRTSYA